MNVAIQKILDNALAEVKALLLEEASAAVSSALSGVGGAGARRASKGTPAKATSGRRAKGAKRSPAELDKLTQDVLAAIKKAKTGIRSEPLAESLGIPTSDLVLPVKRLIDDRKVKTKGVRRGMQYLPRG